MCKKYQEVKQIKKSDKNEVKSFEGKRHTKYIKTKWKFNRKNLHTKNYIKHDFQTLKFSIRFSKSFFKVVFQSCFQSCFSKSFFKVVFQSRFSKLTAWPIVLIVIMSCGKPSWLGPQTSVGMENTNWDSFDDFSLVNIGFLTNSNDKLDALVCDQPIVIIARASTIQRPLVLLCEFVSMFAFYLLPESHVSGKHSETALGTFHWQEYHFGIRIKEQYLFSIFSKLSWFFFYDCNNVAVG